MCGRTDGTPDEENGSLPGVASAHITSLAPYHAQVHVYNSGFAPICSALLSLSENAVVDQAWTVEEVEDEPNLFEVLWTEQGISPDNPRSISRFVGFVTIGYVRTYDS